MSPLQGTKVVIQNLQTSVTQEDIVELFGDIGALKKAKVRFNKIIHNQNYSLHLYETEVHLASVSDKMYSIKCISAVISYFKCFFFLF